MSYWPSYIRAKMRNISLECLDEIVGFYNFIIYVRHFCFQQLLWGGCAQVSKQQTGDGLGADLGV